MIKVQIKIIKNLYKENLLKRMKKKILILNIDDIKILNSFVIIYFNQFNYLIYFY